MWREAPLLGLLVVACGDGVGPKVDDPLLPAASRVVAVATGFSSACVLTAAGRMYCWGENRFGELGDSSRTVRSAPIAVHTDSTFATIAGTQGTSRSCAVTPGGTGYCWGYNLNGELGDGSTVDRWVPAQVVGGIRFASISTSYHTCGLDVAGAAYCWGVDLAGALGSPPGDHTVPAPVATSIRFTTITTGLEFTCALDMTGRVYCWGWGAMVGAGGRPDTVFNSPVPVVTPQRFVSLSAAEEHTCAITQDGAAYCWGKVGGPFDPITMTPTRLVNLPRVEKLVGVQLAPTARVKQVVGGRQFSCVLTVDGRAFCGLLGDTLQLVADSIRFAGLSVGNGLGCGFTEGGAAFCWGETWLANGPPPFGETRFTPVRVVLP